MDALLRDDPLIERNLRGVAFNSAVNSRCQATKGPVCERETGPDLHERVVRSEGLEPPTF